MKLKLGAKRDTSSQQMDEEVMATNVCSVSSQPSTEEANMDADCTPASASSSKPASDDGIVSMDTDCSSVITTSTSPSLSDGVSTGNNSQCSVSILHFFKIKDPVATTSNGSGCASVSSSRSVESNCTSETESTQTFRDSELSE